MLMPASVGIDLVDVTRIADIMARYGQRFLRRILSAQELSQLASRYDRAQFVAGRFAAKEAAVKALGPYLQARPPLHCIDIANDTTGRPAIRFDDTVAAKLPHLKALVSISHEKSHAIAIVVLSEES